MPSLPALLIQPNNCSTHNPIQSLTKNHTNTNNTNHRFIQPSTSQQQHQQQQPTDQFINRQLSQEQQQQQQQQQNDWSTHFLRSAPLLPPIRSSIHSNQWQSEFVGKPEFIAHPEFIGKSEFIGSLQPVEAHHQRPQPINHFHPLIQHRPIGPSIIHHPNFPTTQLNHSTQHSTDWESVFSKYGTHNDVSEQSTLLDPNVQVAPHREYLLGSHSPTRSTSPDALAKTAASLIATVEKNGQLSQDLENINQQFDTTTPSDPAGSAAEKLIQSNFIDFIRKLRDGEIKVEGDRLVEQPAHNSATDLHPTQRTHPSDGSLPTNYGKSYRSFGMSTDMPNNLTESSARSTIGHANESLISNNLDHQDLVTAHRNQLESRMKEMNELMEETDKEIERAQYRERMNAFQGDGGAVFSSPVDLDEILNAASQVGQPRENPSWTTTSTEVPGASELWSEELDAVASQDEGLDEFFDELGMFGRPILPQEIELERLKRAQRVPTPQELEWERFQNDWEKLDDAQHAPVQAANASRNKFLERIKVLRAETGYEFQQVNLHFLEQDNRTRHHSTHLGWDESTLLEKMRLHDEGSVLESVLQREKEVLESPESATAWYELGVKQQENEREELAIQALRKAIQLDPQLSDAILALAISYANENQRDSAFEMIEDWIQVQVSQVPNYREHFRYNNVQEGDQEEEEQDASGSGNNSKKMKIKHEKLTEKLIQLARLGGRVKGSASIDPDVQIALGVLFNSNDDFQKACDCFAAALAVRPSDPLLFNRLGATLANSGKPEEAIEYYQRAIELLPCYIRARYNLSISLINLGKYFESLKNLINALIIQQQDQDHLHTSSSSSKKNNASFDTDTSSDVLWQTLEINCSLLKNELGSVQSDLDDCFVHKDLSRISKILVNFN